MALTVVQSQELKNVLEVAGRMAEHYKEPLNTLHILMAMLAVQPNSAKPILERHGLRMKPEKKNGKKEESPLSLVTVRSNLISRSRSRQLEEPADTLNWLETKAQQLASSHATHIVDTLFYLLSICRIRKATAHLALEKAGVQVARLRTEVTRKISQQVSTRKVRLFDADEPAEKPEATSSQTGIRVEATPQAEATAPQARTEPPPPRSDHQQQMQRAKPRAHQTQEEEPEADTQSDQTSPYDLDEQAFPLLSRMSRNLTREAWLGRIDPVIGRRGEIRQMMQILLKRRTNNPCLVGEPGVGKTALVEGLALEISQETVDSQPLHGRVLLELETAALVAGTSLRGSFSERMMQLREEVRAGKDRFIVFIDEIHTLVGAGAGESALDAANELKAGLARGEFPCVGATTLQEYKKYIESDPALERRFQPIHVREPAPEEAVEIIQGIISFYQEHHGIPYSERSIEAAVRLSVRYIMDRYLPDKAIDLLDMAGSRAALQGSDEVTDEIVALVLAGKVGVPVERLVLTAAERYRNLLDFLQEQIVGHLENLNRMADALKRGFAGFSSERPLASFVLAGPPGVGKFATAQALGSFLLEGSEQPRIFSMAEFTEPHTMAKLIGTSPGYVGHEEGGQLAEAMYRKPFQILVFKDIDLAHREVQELLARLVTSGSLVDGRGRTISFSNAVIIFTATLEPDWFGEARSMGFAPSTTAGTGPDDEGVWERASHRVPLSLRAAVDDGLIFRPLDHQEILSVARRLSTDASGRLLAEQDIGFTLSDPALEFLVELGGYQAEKGLKPMKRLLETRIENPIAERILDGRVRRGHRLTVTVEDGEFQFFLR